MLFYSLLFVGSVIAAILVLYLYNAVVRIGRFIYKARLPDSKENLTNHLDGARYSTAVNDAKTPWGWGGHTSPQTTARTHPASPNRQAPWGWAGKENDVRNRGRASANANKTGFDAFLASSIDGSGSKAGQGPTVSWPYREDKSEAAGRVYKVTRKASLPRTNLKDTAKPWGW